MTTLYDGILSVFLNRNKQEMTDTELNDALAKDGMNCNLDAVRRHVQSLSPAIFHLIKDYDESLIIRVEPKIEICGQFLNACCRAPPNTCDKLHICRHFGRCDRSDCHFPHDFTRGRNQYVVSKYKCQRISHALLVEFLRRKSSVQTPTNRRPYAGQGRNPSKNSATPPNAAPLKTLGHAPSLMDLRSETLPTDLPIQTDDSDRQVDLSLPSETKTNQITRSDIQSYLAGRGITIDALGDESDDGYSRRMTITLEQSIDVDVLLRTPFQEYKGVVMKFKRTKLIIDAKSFLLKISIDDEGKEIELSHLRTYIDQLVDRHSIDTMTDLSTDSEQILYVQCKNNINFNQIHQRNVSQPQFSGKDITVIQVYQCDSITVHCSDDQPMDEADLKFIFQPFLSNIFIYKFPSQTYAEVEFINSDSFKQCMSAKNSIQEKYQVIITPFVDSVDENSIDTRSTTSTEYEIQTHRTTISLRLDWALIANHPVFKGKYIDFIRKELNGEIQIKDDEATYMNGFPKHFMSTRSDLILLNKTADFMRKFRCETFENLDEDQLEILCKNANTVAYKHLQDNDYLVAIESSKMPKLKEELFPPKKSPRIESPVTSKPSMGTSTTPKPLVNTSATSKPSTSTSTASKSLMDTSTTSKPAMTTSTTSKSFMGTSATSKPSMTTSAASEPFVTTSAASEPFVTTSTASTTTYSIEQTDQRKMFLIKRFENDLQEYFERKFHVKLVCKRTRNKIHLEIGGEVKSMEDAVNCIHQLFSSLRMKQFKDKSSESWSIIDDADQVINHHFEISEWICLAERSSSNTVDVYHFDKHQPFGRDERKIDEFITDRFRSAHINLKPSKSAQLINNMEDIIEQIRRQNEYLKDICFFEQSMVVHLFGLPELVKSYRDEFEKLQHNQEAQPCRITLSEEQLNYLIHVAKSDMNKLEKEYQSAGCDVSLARLRRNCEFLAPLNLHTEIQDKIQALAQIRQVSFTISNPALDVLLSKEPERLLSLVKSKCYLEKTIESFREPIPIPKARVIDSDDLMQSTASGRSDEQFIMKIGHSTVTIMTGDLVDQKVDAIALCTTSGNLCRDVVSRAGAKTKKEYDRLRSEDEFPGATSGGDLPCKKIIFIPWASGSGKASEIETALNEFIASAFMFAEDCQSLAFPAVGCGELRFEPSLVAKYMLLHIRDQLKNLKSKMNISVVLLPEQRHVYDAFVRFLKEIENIDPSATAKLPSTKKDNPSSILFEKRTVKFTLIGSNDYDLIECKDSIIKLVQSYSKKKSITTQELLDWPQTAIEKYYDHCLKQRVIPTIDLESATLELFGPKEAVNEAETYFYELVSQILNNQRIRAISRGIIWLVEWRPSSDRWDQYSYRLNGVIEDAYDTKRSYVEFVNEKDEQCRIDFSTMRETIGSISRRVHRTTEDSTLPPTWTSSSENCVRVVLLPSSNEFQEVRHQFDETMRGKYSQIIRIERIQNERWYKQYAAHREDFRRRHGEADERQLFHGCSSISADQIITTCFNRTFAGVNGVLYGHGVYFHTQARYSHQYAAKNNAGERTMFIARVLIGKTCVGDSSMKAPPIGYDTTSDGKQIFVIYHDAGAYAEYLITYKGE